MLEALVFPIVSHHFQAEIDHRETHPGVIAELRIDGARYGIGAYRNSFDRTTVVALRRFPAVVGGPVTVGASVGLCSGYRQPVCGFVSVELYGRMTVILAPSMESSKGAVILAWRQPI